MGGQLFEREGDDGSFARNKRATMINTQEEEKGLLSGFRDIFTSFKVQGGA